MSAANTERLKANELVIMLSSLLNLDVTVMARVANVPRRNLLSWLAGKKGNLRIQSIISLLTLLGIKIKDGIHLDDKRVHFWQVNDKLFARGQGKNAYAAISKLSKLMPGCMITKVLPAGKAGIFSRREYFLVYGDNVRVVITVNRGWFRSAKVGPEIIKGAYWRDDNDHHTIATTRKLWGNLLEKDLTTHEFDRMFMQIEETVSWVDISLISREFGITPQNISDWILERYGEAEGANVDDGRGDDVDGGRILELVHYKAA